MKQNRDIIIYRNEHAYCTAPEIVQLTNGEWFVVFNQTMRLGLKLHTYWDPSSGSEPYLHPPGDPLYRHYSTRSFNRGETWDTPQVVPDYSWSGVEQPGLTLLGNGDILLNQWKFAWWPLTKARKIHGLPEVGRIYVRDPHSVLLSDGVSGDLWNSKPTDEVWEKSSFPWARGDGELNIHISGDGGRTWDETVHVDTSPYPGGYSPSGGTQLRDGTVVLALCDIPQWEVTFAIHSRDNGRSWSKPVEVGRSLGKGVEEPTIVETAGGKVVVMCRDQDSRMPKSEGYLLQIESSDKGHTWSSIRKTPMWGAPAHLVGLTDGRLLCVYGYRREPYGIRGCISRDEGKTWDIDREIIIRDDLGNSNLGYPCAIEYEPGHIFVAYWGEDSEGVTCIQGTYFTL